MMKSHSLKKLLAAVMVVALLVMALPMTILAVQPVKTKTNQGQALGHNKDKNKVEDIEEEEEPSEEEEEMSWRAEFVHLRNDWAKSEDFEAGKMRIPPGHANLMLRYLISLEEPAALPAGEPLVETETIRLFSDYADDLAQLYEDLKTPEEPTAEDPAIKEPIIDPVTGRLNVKAFKEWAGMIEEDELAPETKVA